ncbi:hypothetical protein Droror1_Dr00025166, partial [Drosera rotundifolia]
MKLGVDAVLLLWVLESLKFTKVEGVGCVCVVLEECGCKVLLQNPHLECCKIEEEGSCISVVGAVRLWTGVRLESFCRSQVNIL